MVSGNPMVMRLLIRRCEKWSCVDWGQPMWQVILYAFSFTRSVFGTLNFLYKTTVTEITMGLFASLMVTFLSQTVVANSEAVHAGSPMHLICKSALKRIIADPIGFSKQSKVHLHV